MTVAFVPFFFFFCWFINSQAILLENVISLFGMSRLVWGANLERTGILRGKKGVVILVFTGH